MRTAMLVLVLCIWCPSCPAEVQELDFEPYVYKARVVSVYDADTVTLDIDLGFNVRTTQKIRLYGINTWEIRGPEKPKGIIARNWLREQILGAPVFLRTHKDKQGKYGRYLGTLYKRGHNGDWVDLNHRLIELGHGVTYNP